MNLLNLIKGRRWENIILHSCFGSEVEKSFRAVTMAAHKIAAVVSRSVSRHVVMFKSTISRVMRLILKHSVYLS